MLIPADEYRVLNADCWAALPDELRRDGVTSEWAAANARAPVASFLEGPDLAGDGTLYCVDIPFGRIFAVSPSARWRVVCEYDGWPNGLKVQRNGRLLVADHKHGIVEVDATTGERTTLLSRRNAQSFLGVNDLHVAADGAVWFTDQGQTGLHDPSGRVYRWMRDESLTCVLDGLPSPNGLRVSADGQEFFVAVTRDNSIWRAPLKGAMQPTKVGRFAMFYGPVGPDGMHLDAEQRIWVCLPGGDAVWVLNPRGEAVMRIRFPDGAFPTNLVLDEAQGWAYVTCAGAHAIFRVSYRA